MRYLDGRKKAAFVAVVIGLVFGALVGNSASAQDPVEGGGYKCKVDQSGCAAGSNETCIGQCPGPAGPCLCSTG